MSLDSYANLQSSVANWLARTDLTAVIPDFIALAEVRFNRELRLNAQDSTYSGTLSGGNIPIPADLVDLKRITITRSSKEHDLRYVSPEDFDEYAAQSGYPCVYTSLTNSYQVAPGPDSNYPYTIYYSAKFPALSNTNTSNWLLANAPDVYLYGTLLEATPFLKDDDRLSLWATAYQNSIDKLKSQDSDMRYPNANLYMRAEVYA